jgi:ACS family tartrate transporter-like MFS transporter
MAEAGLLPGFLLYMTYWFPAAWRGRIAAAITLAVPLSLVIGGPVSGLILGLSFFDGLAGLKSWQWMFVIEGIPAVIAGRLAYRLMPDRPGEARWLTREEAKALQTMLDADAAAHPAYLHGSELIHGLLSAPVLLLGVSYFCAVLGGFGIIFWVPQIVKAFGLSNIETGFVASIPYAVAALVMGALAFFGDSTGKAHSLHRVADAGRVARPRGRRSFGEPGVVNRRAKPGRQRHLWQCFCDDVGAAIFWRQSCTSFIVRLILC